MIIPSSHRYTYICSQPDTERYINVLLEHERRQIQSGTPRINSALLSHAFEPVLTRSPTASPSIRLSDLLLLLNAMHMLITQNAQMSKILRMARITPTLLQVQSQALNRRINNIRAKAVTFFGVAAGAVGAAFLAVEEGTVGGEADGENADVEFDHCPDVDGDVGPWGIVSVEIVIVCLGGGKA